MKPLSLGVTGGGIFGSKHLSVAQIGLRCYTAASVPLTCFYIRLHTSQSFRYNWKKLQKPDLLTKSSFTLWIHSARAKRAGWYVNIECCAKVLRRLSFHYILLLMTQTFTLYIGCFFCHFQSSPYAWTIFFRSAFCVKPLNTDLFKHKGTIFKGWTMFEPSQTNEQNNFKYYF